MNRSPSPSSILLSPYWALFIMFLFALLSSSHISANDNSQLDPYSFSLEDLLNLEITSAGKSSEAVGDVPASVTIITRSDIEKYGYASLPDIVRNIPGMFILDNTESLFIGMRGITGGGVQFLVNGIPQHPSLHKGLHSTDVAEFNIPVEAIDQIEVIRGPMSVIYGNNAFLGVINIITNDVDRKDTLGAMSYGSNNSGRFHYRHGATSDKGYLIVNAGGYKTNGLSGRFSEMLSPAQLSGVHAAADDKIDNRVGENNHSIDISAAHDHFTANVRYGKMVRALYPTAPPIGNPNNIEISTYHASLAYDQNLTDALSFKATGIISTEEYLIPRFYFISPTTHGNQVQTSRRSVLEFNLMYQEGELEVMSGYRYKKIDDLYNKFYLTQEPTGSLIELSRTYVEDVNTQELFSQASYNYTPDWRIIAGLRYLSLPDRYKTKPTSSASRETKIAGDSQVTGRIALLHDLNEQHKLKFLIGSAAQDRDEFQYSEPETIMTYEVNHTMTQYNFQLSSSLFHNITEHIIERTYAFDPITNKVIDISDNTGKWETIGLEAISDYRVNDQWRITGSITAQKTEDTANNVRAGYSPNFLAKLKTDYTEGPYTYSVNSYFIHHMYSGYQMLDPDKNPSTPLVAVRNGAGSGSYAIWGANVRYAASEKTALSLKIDNLFDKSFRYPTNEIANMKNGLIGMGRVITASASYEF